MSKYDIAIIGAGPGGYVAAIYAAGRGKKVILIEEDRIGGVCLNKGCIPTKTLISLLERKTDLAEMMQKKEEVTSKLRSAVEGLLKAKGVEIKKGRGILIDKGVIQIGSERIETQSIIVASGSRPAELKSFKFDTNFILSSDDILNLNQVPKRLLIIGGGFIGCEFGYIYNALGADVTIVEMMDRLLPAMDEDLSKGIELSFKKKKIKYLTRAKAEESSKSSFDKILVAVGRRPNIEDMGLEKLGIKTESGFIKVNEFLCTNIEGIYAIGDVIGSYMLAHVASHEGICAVSNILGEKRAMDYTSVPSCVYTQPEIASCGLTTQEAGIKGYKVKVAKFPFRASGKAHAIGKTDGFVKMVADEKRGVILGVQIMGPEATDLIASAVLMVKFKLKAKDITQTIHAHPTLSEALMEAAFSLTGTPIHTL